MSERREKGAAGDFTGRKVIEGIKRDGLGKLILIKTQRACIYDEKSKVYPPLPFIFISLVKMVKYEWK